LSPGRRTNRKNFKKLSKNDYVSTPSIFRVNEKLTLLTLRVFNPVQPVHRQVTENSARAEPTFFEGLFPMGLLVQFIEHNRYSGSAGSPRLLL
jgi:hypothetical protein